MATLTTLRAQLRKDLHDEDSTNYRWLDAVLDRHIERANRELSLALPREQKTTLQTGAGSRDVSLSSLAGLVRIEAVEYPAGLYPASYVRFSVWQTTLTLLIETVPGGVEDVEVYWFSLHTVDGSSCTLPGYAEEALLTGAAGYAATELASYMTNRANVAGAAAVDAYQTWGELQLRRFRQQLAAFGERSRLRASSLYRPAAAYGRDVVSWE
jgi:hypothetical protein